MSKGSKVVPVRIPDDLLERMAELLETAGRTRTGEPWTTSSFIRAAIEEKIRKMERSRAPRKKKPVS